MVFGKELLSHLLQVLGGETVNMSHDVVEVALLTLMQEGLGEIEGELFTTIAGDGQLTLQLLFGLVQLGGSERSFHQSVQLAAYQLAATSHIMWVAAEIDAPTAYVAIAYHATFHAIYQSVTFTQRQIES